MNADSLDLDALEAEFGLDDIADDPAYGGLLDSVSQAFMYDKQLIEARKATQAANISAKTVRAQRREARLAAGQARAQRKQAVEQKRAMRAQTATVKSQASQERLVATEQARAEQQRTAKEAARLAQMRLATQQEGQQRRTAATGQRRDTADTRRSVAQVSNVQLLTEATADPTRIVTKAGAPIQAAAALSAPAPAPVPAPASVGAEPEARRFPILGYVLVGTIIATLAGAFYVEARTPVAPPPPRPRYARLPIPE